MYLVGLLEDWRVLRDPSTVPIRRSFFPSPRAIGENNKLRFSQFLLGWVFPEDLGGAGLHWQLSFFVEEKGLSLQLG